MLRRLLATVRARVTRRRVHVEADDELAFHVEQETAANLARGMTPSEARRAALRDLGGMMQQREAVRRVRMWWPDTLEPDVRYALRLLRRRPGFAAAAIVILALGVGVNVAAFSVVRAAFLKDLPYADPDRLVKLWQIVPRALPQDFSLDDIEAIRRGVPALAAVTGATVQLANIRGNTAVSTVVHRVAPDFFPLFGVAAVRGRTLDAGDFQDESRAVIAYRTWQEEFGGDSAVIGRMLVVNGTPMPVVGVMPASFTPTSIGIASDTAAWIPFHAAPRASNTLTVYGRLAPGATIESAQAQLASVMKPRQQAQDVVAAGRGAGRAFTGVQVEGLDEQGRSRVRSGLILVQTIAAVLLVAACASLGHLFLAAAAGRQRELGVRIAIGASRGTIVRQLVTEAGVVAALGGLAGVGLAFFLLPLMIAAIPTTLLPERMARVVGVGKWELVAGLSMSGLTAVVFAMAPAYLAFRTDPMTLLRDAARRSAGASVRVLRSALVTTQVALAVITLTSASLLIVSLVRLMHLPTGFDPKGLATAEITLPAPVPWSAEISRARQRQLIDDLSAGLGSRPFTVGSKTPYTGLVATREWTIRALQDSSRASDAKNAESRMISPNYFELLGIRTVAGRVFDAADNAHGTRVAVVDETFARRYAPGVNLVGTDLIGNGDQTPITVVGIVADTIDSRMSFAPRPAVYQPLDQAPTSHLTVTVRSPDLAPVRAALQAAVRRAGADASSANVGWLTTKMMDSEGQRTFYLTVLVIFGTLAVALAAAGVYGVTAYLTRLRMREVGIRLALGAAPGRVSGLVIRQALVPVTTGIVAGLIASWWLTMALKSNVIFIQFRAQLFHIEPADPATFASAGVLVLVIGVLACGVPAHRAARISPAAALRAE